MDRTELHKYSKELDLNLGQTEKNYFQSLILFAISKFYPQKLVFKGGTCLMIAYNLDRFSKDLDFNIIEEFNQEEFFEKIINFLQRYNINSYYVKNNKTKSSITYIMYIEGPLYIGTNQSLCKVEFDFSHRKDISGKIKLVKINHIYNEFPIFNLNVLSLEEIFAEKIRAIMTRNKSRDVYDLNYLINRKVNLDISLINKKLKVYNLKFSFKKFSDSLNKKEKIWDKEMRYLVKIYPKFEEVKRNILTFLK